MTTFTIMPNGNLRVSLTDKGMQYRNDMFDEMDSKHLEPLQTYFEHGHRPELFDVLETPLCNGYNTVKPESIGAITSALIIADGVIDEETTIEDLAFIKMWYFPMYESKDELELLFVYGYFDLVPLQITQQKAA